MLLQENRRELNLEMDHVFSNPSNSRFSTLEVPSTIVNPHEIPILKVKNHPNHQPPIPTPDDRSSPSRDKIRRDPLISALARKPPPSHPAAGSDNWTWLIYG